MLLTLLGNLNMFGGEVPVPPIDNGSSGSGGWGIPYQSEKDIEKGRKEKRIKEEEEWLLFIRCFLMNRN